DFHVTGVQTCALPIFKPFLFMEMILKEKDFRASLQQHDWEQYRNKVAGVFCSADAIIPFWAYMLVASYLKPVAKDVLFGDKNQEIGRASCRVRWGIE